MGDSLKDLQREVSEWADSVYPNRSFQTTVGKFHEEIAELEQSGHADPSEFADVLILALDLATQCGIDIEAAVRAKLEVNYKRKWAVDQHTGLMSHVKGPEDA